MIFKKYIETLIEVVSAFEALRQRLTNQKGMDTVIGFNSLDFDNDGKISSKDVRNWRKMQNFDWILD